MRRFPHGSVRFVAVSWFHMFSRIAACLAVYLLVLLPGPVVSQERRADFESAGSAEKGAGLDIETIQEFDQLDRDANQSLDQMEFLFSEIAQRFRGRNDRKLIDRVFANIDRDKSDSIELLEFAQSQHNRNVRILDRESSANFRESDLDQDGFISLEEYRKRPGANDSIFEKIDLNGNGIVGPLEWMIALEKRAPEKEKEAKLVFAKLDADDNGALSPTEWEAEGIPEKIADAFSDVDLNGNREVGIHEFSKALAMPADELAAPLEVLRVFRDMDTNHDGVINLREFSRKAPPTRRGGDGDMIERIFDRIDRNNNREIDLKEFGDSPRGGPMRDAPFGRGKGKGPGDKRR